MDWHNSESTVEPLTVDETMSKIYVYLRKNIASEDRTDEDGNTTTWYVYDETIILKDDYYEIAACIQTDENSQGLLDVADLADENSTAITDLAEYIAELEARVEALEG